jgi:hypothetical protein
MLRLSLWQSVVLDDRWRGTQRVTYSVSDDAADHFLSMPLSLAANKQVNTSKDTVRELN